MGVDFAKAILLRADFVIELRKHHHLKNIIYV